MLSKQSFNPNESLLRQSFVVGCLLLCYAFATGSSVQADPIESKSLVTETKALTQGATTDTITLKIKRPKSPRGASLGKGLRIRGCWLADGLKSLTALDASKRKVKFRRAADGSGLEFKKVKTLKFPLKIKLKLNAASALIAKGSALSVLGQTNCLKVKGKNGKMRDDCSAVQPVSVFGAFSGIACNNPSDFEEQSSFAEIVFADGDEFAVRAKNENLRFAMKNGAFLSDLADATVILNDTVYVQPDLQLVNGVLVVNAPLADGLNQVKVLALDSEGMQAEAAFHFWAGSNSLTVLFRDAQGQVVDSGELTLSVADDPDFYRVASFSGGQAVFENLPGTTISVSAKSSDGKAGFSAGAGNDGTLTVTMIPVLPESPVDNNDISQGALGWEAGSGANVYVVPHDEAQASVANAASGGGWTEIPNAAGGPDQDLVLQTSGEGPRFMTRTFRTDPRSRLVRIRYRFQTNEYPGGYFGSKYNDFYNVALRSSQGAHILDDGSSMNALGRPAFSPNGYTVWKSTVIPVNRTSQSHSNGEVVQASVVVANVADGAYDSRVVVDKIEESSFAITEAHLFDIDNSPLKRISADSHPYFNGFTWINGTITLEGDKDDKVTELYLQLMDGSTQVGRAEISSQAAAKVLNVKFGKSGRIQLKMPMLLFKIFPNVLTGLNSTTDRGFSLVIQAKNDKGQTAHTSIGSVQQLVHFTGTARYDPRDEALGGDDWLLPSIRQKANAFSGVTWGDFSNMNGGRFSPHTLHQDGRSADGWVDGYNALDESTAQSLIDLLNSSPGQSVRFMYVRFNRNPGNRFYQAISGRTLNNGRPLNRVILPDGEHGTHFHVEF